MFKNRLYRFAIIGGGLFLIWFLLYHVWLDQKTLDAPIIHFQTHVSGWLLNLFGQPATVQALEGRFSSILNIDGAAVMVGGECGGLELIILFAGFVLAFGGQIKKMAWFIPMGIAVILALNILRIAGLAMMVVHTPSWVHINHKYTFVILVYAAIFALWVMWTKKYGGVEEVDHEEQPHNV